MYIPKAKKKGRKCATFQSSSSTAVNKAILCRYYFTASLRALPGLNAGTLLAGI